MNNTLKILLAILAALIVVAVALFSFLEYRNATVVAFESIVVGRGNIEDTLSISGIVKAEKREDFNFGGGDRIKELKANLGDFVEKDEILVVFENGFEIKAPFDGTIVAFNGYEFQKAPAVQAQGAQPLLVIADLESREFIGEADEDDLSKIDVGQDVRLECDISKDMLLEGEISQRGRVANTRIDGSLFFSVNAEITDFNEVGDTDTFSCDAEIIIESFRNVIIAPFDSVSTKNGNQIVYVVDEDGVFEERKIQVGLESESGFQVISGLEAGDTIVKDAESVKQE